MRSVVEFLEAPLNGALPGLLLAPSGHFPHDVHADVRRAGDALLLAQLAVVRPRLIVDADYAARLPLRRHIASVADRAMAGHPTRGEWLLFGYSVTGHPAVGFKGAKAAPDPQKKPP